MMTRDKRSETLEKIQDIANFLPVEYDLPDEACEYLRIIEALCCHADNPDVLSPADNERLARTKSG
jgi:hypothetical protein